MNDITYLYKLRTFYRDHGRMPSYGEMAELFGFRSKNAVTHHVQKWIAEGRIAKDEAGKLLPGKGMNGLRILGRVQAGFPSPAEEENLDTISLDDWLIEHREATFMLQVSGDSMIDAGIHPGDMVLLERGRPPVSGTIVVAEVDHEWTIKYLDVQGKSVRLLPANKKYQPIVPEDELRIAGVVTAVIRKYG